MRWRLLVSCDGDGPSPQAILSIAKKHGSAALHSARALHAYHVPPAPRPEPPRRRRGGRTAPWPRRLEASQYVHLHFAAADEYALHRLLRALRDRGCEVRRVPTRIWKLFLHARIARHRRA